MKELTRIDRQVLLQQGLKHCPQCERILSVDEFVRNETKHDKLSVYCRSCEKKRRVLAKDSRLSILKLSRCKSGGSSKRPTRMERKVLLERGLKHCPKCGHILVAEDFAHDENRSDKLCVYCRSCSRAYRVQYKISTASIDQPHKHATVDVSKTIAWYKAHKAEIARRQQQRIAVALDSVEEERVAP